jgi:prolyl-tRNA editing enzyme YbaK/EbsC (Cys-tRNA(Pro) deacylase)
VLLEVLVTGSLSRETVDHGDPRIQHLLVVAAQKGVTLDIRPLRSPMLTPPIEEVASEVGCDVGQVVNSRVCVAPRPGGLLKPIVCMTVGDSEIALELLAAVAGEVETRVATVREARDLLTCSPGLAPAFGHGRNVSVVMDRDLGGYQWVWAPTGLAFAILRISPRTLRMLSNATVAPVTKVSRVRSMGSLDGSASLRFGTA